MDRAVVSRGRLVLILGGQKSGKSGLAARIARHTDRPVVVLAPARAGDAEMAERIAIHRADRPAGWSTDEDLDLQAALDRVAVDATVVVDALDTWLAEEMTSRDLWTTDPVAPWGAPGRAAADAIVSTARTVARSGRHRPGTTILIAGQPGLGAHAMDAGGRRYVDLHGRVLQAVARSADQVLLVMAGQVLPLQPVDSYLADLAAPTGPLPPGPPTDPSAGPRPEPGTPTG